MCVQRPDVCNRISLNVSDLSASCSTGHVIVIDGTALCFVVHYNRWYRQMKIRMPFMFDAHLTSGKLMLIDFQSHADWTPNSCGLDTKLMQIGHQTHVKGGSINYHCKVFCQSFYVLSSCELFLGSIFLSAQSYSSRHTPSFTNKLTSKNNLTICQS